MCSQASDQSRRVAVIAVIISVVVPFPTDGTCVTNIRIVWILRSVIL